jgi:hypothetical protein
MSIDFTKPVQTRNGDKVRILCTDAVVDDGEPVIGLYRRNGCDIVGGWDLSGKWSSDDDYDHPMDLVNVPPPKNKVKVEVRLVQTSDGVEAYAKCANGFDVWWPHEEDEEVIAATSIEMEYQP